MESRPRAGVERGGGEGDGRAPAGGADGSGRLARGGGVVVEGEGREQGTCGIEPWLSRASLWRREVEGPLCEYKIRRGGSEREEKKERREGFRLG